MYSNSDDDSFEFFVDYVTGRESYEICKQVTTLLLTARWYSESTLSLLPKDIVKNIAKYVWEFRHEKRAWTYNKKIYLHKLKEMDSINMPMNTKWRDYKKS